MLVRAHLPCTLAEPVQITRATERALRRPGSTTVLHASPATGATRLCVLEQTHETGAGAPTHRHPGSEETITVLAGRATFWVEQQSEVLDTGCTLIIPPNSWHGFRNNSKQPLRIIASIAGTTPLVEYETQPGQEIEIGSPTWRAHWNGPAPP